MEKSILFSMVFLLASSLPASATTARFQAESVHPGKTTQEELRNLLGKPRRVVKEGASREFYFYDLGEGAAMDATVCVRKGMVEYLSYLCHEGLDVVHEKYGAKPTTERILKQSGPGYAGKLVQLIYENAGRGFLYLPKSRKIKACFAWEPGQKFDELGK